MLAFCPVSELHYGSACHRQSFHLGPGSSRELVADERLLQFPCQGLKPLVCTFTYENTAISLDFPLQATLIRGMSTPC